MFIPIFFNKKKHANANVMIAFFIHLHIVSVSDVKNMRKITSSRKTSILLNRLQNIQIAIKLSYLRRLSRIVERDIYTSNSE